MRKTEPTRFFLPHQMLSAGGEPLDASPRWGGGRNMLFWWQTPGGSSSLQGPSMNLDPAVCKEEILSSIFSSAILSPKKLF